MFDERAAHACRLFWSQRDASTALVLEVVHLLGDDVRCFSKSEEHSEVLEHRRDDVAISGRKGDLGKHVLEGPPALGVRGEDVSRSGARAEGGHV